MKAARRAPKRARAGRNSAGWRRWLARGGPFQPDELDALNADVDDGGVHRPNCPFCPACRTKRRELESIFMALVMAAVHKTDDGPILLGHFLQITAAAGFRAGEASAMAELLAGRRPEARS